MVQLNYLGKSGKVQALKYSRYKSKKSSPLTFLPADSVHC